MRNLGRSEVHLRSIVRKVESALRRTLEKNIVMVTRADGRVSPILANAEQLEQALLILCLQARQSMPEGGMLRIELSQTSSAVPGSAGRVLLRVSDTGQGLDPERQQRLSELPFGGEVCVSSAPGRGTAVSLTFPAVALANAAVNAGSAEPVILLVEDDRAVRSVTARILRRRGYGVIEAHRPSEALAVSARDERLDLLLTDLVMPEMMGNELAAELTCARPQLRVLYMTGYAGSAFERLSGAAGTQRPVLHKPFTADELLDSVRCLLADQLNRADTERPSWM